MIRDSVTVTVSVGDEILVGKFRNSRATINKIEVNASGEVTLKTSKGERNLLTFRQTSETFDDGRKGADKYR